MNTKTKKTFTTTDLRPGRIYTLEYSNVVELVGYRKENPSHKNPLKGSIVTVDKQIKIQAAGEKTYANVMLKDNPNWTPSLDVVAWWFPLAENSCVVEHKKEATRYLRGIPLGTNSKQYFVDGLPATAAQVATIQEFKKSKRGKFQLVALHNITNLVDETGEDE